MFLTNRRPYWFIFRALDGVDRRPLQPREGGKPSPEQLEWAVKNKRLREGSWKGRRGGMSKGWKSSSTNKRKEKRENNKKLKILGATCLDAPRVRRIVEVYTRARLTNLSRFSILLSDFSAHYIQKLTFGFFYRFNFDTIAIAVFRG